jgi:hypothetical protein
LISAAFFVHREPGYKFCHARGLIVLDTAISLVAVLPIGMAQVLSIILTIHVRERQSPLSKAQSAVAGINRSAFL